MFNEFFWNMCDVIRIELTKYAIVHSNFTVFLTRYIKDIYTHFSVLNDQSTVEGVPLWIVWMSRFDGKLHFKLRSQSFQLIILIKWFSFFLNVKLNVISSHILLSCLESLLIFKQKLDLLKSRKHVNQPYPSHS